MRTIYKCSECLVYPMCTAICMEMKSHFGLLTHNLRNSLARSFNDSRYFNDYIVSKTIDGLHLRFERNTSWPIHEQYISVILTNEQLKQYFQKYDIINITNTCKIEIHKRRLGKKKAKV